MRVVPIRLAAGGLEQVEKAQLGVIRELETQAYRSQAVLIVLMGVEIKEELVVYIQRLERTRVLQGEGELYPLADALGAIGRAFAEAEFQAVAQIEGDPIRQLPVRISFQFQAVIVIEPVAAAETEVGIGHAEPPSLIRLPKDLGGDELFFEAGAVIPPAGFGVELHFPLLLLPERKAQALPRAEVIRPQSMRSADEGE